MREEQKKVIQKEMDTQPSVQYSRNTQSPDTNPQTETKEPDKDLGTKLSRKKSEVQHTSHWDPLHCIQYSKFFIPARQNMSISFHAC